MFVSTVGAHVKRIKRPTGVFLLAGLIALAMACGTGGSGSEPEQAQIPAPATARVVTPSSVIRSTTTPVPTLTPAPEPTATPEPNVFAGVPGILDPNNFGWPRQIETSEGVVTLDAPPQRVYSMSLGHAEILAALVGADKLIAVVSFFADPSTSAAWAEFEPLPKAGSDPEEIVSLAPDLVLASSFTSSDTTEILKELGISVVRADLETSALGNIPNILFMGYLLGAEDRAVALAAEIKQRLDYVDSLTPGAEDEKPRVLAMSRFFDIYVAGGGSTEGGIIEAAGGVNVAAESGIDGHQTISPESIVAMNPDIILLTQPEEGALEFASELYSLEALSGVPAVRDRRVIYADPVYYTTLSHWNVRGIEDAAKIFFPDAFAAVTFKDFSPYSE